MNHVSRTSFLAIATACGLLAGCLSQPGDEAESDEVGAGEDEDVGEAASNLVWGLSLIAKPGHNFALNLHGNTHGDGAVVNLWERNGHASQTWTFGADGRIHPSGDAQFCLAHWGDAHTPNNGSAAVLWSCVDHDSQRWTAWPDGTIRKQSNSTKCLNLDSNAYQSGHVVDVYDCNGHESQQWVRQSVAEPIVKPGRNFALNLDYNAHANGAVVNLWERNGHASQTWTFGADGRIHPSGDTQFCLAHWGDANTPNNGSAAVLWSCVDHDSQRWTAWPDGTIRKQSNPTKCLNLPYNAYQSGHVVDVHDCNGHESQQWVPQSAEGQFHPAGAQAAGELGSLFSSYGGDEPPLSMGRGVGTIPNGCDAGYEKDGELCYPSCAPGYDGVGPVCWEICPSGYTDTGALCTYSDGPLVTGLACHGTSSFPFVSCSCPPNYTNTGVACAANTIAKGSYGRGAGDLLSCGAGLEKDAGLCYTPCSTGYDGVGPVCWLDGLGIGDVMSCKGLYNPDLASHARATGTTIWFGYGIGMTMYTSLSNETGVVYGPGGEFGCYATTCAGQGSGVAVNAWGTFGFSSSGFDQFSGDSFVGQVGMAIGPAGLSGSPVTNEWGQLVGASASVSLSISPLPIPVDFGAMTCNTVVNQVY